MGGKQSKSQSSAPVVTHKSAVQQQKTEAGGKAVVKVLVGIANLRAAFREGGAKKKKKKTQSTLRMVFCFAGVFLVL